MSLAYPHTSVTQQICSSALRGSRSLRPISSWLLTLRHCTLAFPTSRVSELLVPSWWSKIRKHLASKHIHSEIIGINFDLKLLYLYGSNVSANTGCGYGHITGTSCAPSYANLFLGGWEKTVFVNESLQPFLNQVLFWHRLIDDLFLIWTGSETSLIEFIELLNINDFNLRFTLSYDPSSVPFLDLRIIKGPNGQIQTDLYR